MVNFKLNGIEVKMPDGATLLETAAFLGIDIPTLCNYDGLEPYGSCRLCVVELRKGNAGKLVTSCNHPVLEGLDVLTHSARVVRARKVLVELLVARSPNSKLLQDMASAMGVRKIRFKMENEECILCGRCVRMCEQQMMSGAIGFAGRGSERIVSTPFHDFNDICRNCGACMYICPVCELPCPGHKAEGQLCNSCLKADPTCTEYFDHVMCYMDSTGCGSCVNEKSHGKKPVKLIPINTGEKRISRN